MIKSDSEIDLDEIASDIYSHHLGEKIRGMTAFDRMDHKTINSPINTDVPMKFPK